jgi:hypothetical protein
MLSKFRVLAFGVAVTLFGFSTARADIVIDQPYNDLPEVRDAIEYTDGLSVLNSTYQFDDFTLPMTCDPGILRVYGVDESTVPLAMRNIDVVAEIWSDLPPGTGTGTIIRTVSGTQLSDGELYFDFTGQPSLGPGTYWITAYVVRDLSVAGQGRWLWGTNMPATGSEAYFWNPNDGLGFGSDPIPGSDVYDDVRNMAFHFTLTGGGPVIPEPSSILLLTIGSSCLGGYAWRKRRQVKAAV